MVMPTTASGMDTTRAPAITFSKAKTNLLCEDKHTLIFTISPCEPRYRFVPWIGPENPPDRGSPKASSCGEPQTRMVQPNREPSACAPLLSQVCIRCAQKSPCQKPPPTKAPCVPVFAQQPPIRVVPPPLPLMALTAQTQMDSRPLSNTSTNLTSTCQSVSGLMQLQFRHQTSHSLAHHLPQAYLPTVWFCIPPMIQRAPAVLVRFPSHSTPTALTALIIPANSPWL